MITINLIPQQQKKLLQHGRNFAALREAVMLVFLFASIMALMLWVSRYYLEVRLGEIAQQNAANIMSNEFTSGRIAKINSQISSAKVITNNYLPLRPTLEKIAAAIPESVALKTISYSRNPAAIHLSGTAKTRNDLLALKTLLEQTPWITGVDLPMTYLVEKDNNAFEISLTIDSAKLAD